MCKALKSFNCQRGIKLLVYVVLLMKFGVILDITRKRNITSQITKLLTEKLFFKREILNGGKEIYVKNIIFYSFHYLLTGNEYLLFLFKYHGIVTSHFRLFVTNVSCVETKISRYYLLKYRMVRLSVNLALPHVQVS